MREKIGYYKGEIYYAPYTLYMDNNELMHEFEYPSGSKSYINFMIVEVNSEYLSKGIYEHLINDIKSWRKYTQECVK